MAERKYVYATGKRKTATAKVRLYSAGKGQITVNSVSLKEYCTVQQQFAHVYAPLKLLGVEKAFDISVVVRGGGSIGQAEAIQHGISKALLELNPEYRPMLKKAGFLTRDPRVKERKKPGLKRARRAPQWAKR